MIRVCANAGLSMCYSEFEIITLNSELGFK